MYTDVKDVEVTKQITSVLLRFKGKYYNEPPRWHEWSLGYSDAFFCCGAKCLNRFAIFAAAKQLQSFEHVNRLRNVLVNNVSGGNVAFILNDKQKKECKTLLTNMRKLGGLRSMKFKNHTHGHGIITLYVWTMNGKGK